MVVLDLLSFVSFVSLLEFGLNIYLKLETDNAFVKAKGLAG